MITVRIKGGLGNQMFQYAAGYALAKRLNQQLKLDTFFFPLQNLRSYELDSLAVEYSEIQPREPFGIRILKERYINKIIRRLDVRIISLGQQNVYLLETCSDLVPEYFTIDKQNIYIDGYYHSEKYFGQYRKEILKQFLPNYRQEKPFHEVLQKIQSCNSVAVHVRRGDFLKIQNDRNPRHYLLGEEYYKNALAYMEQKWSNLKFFWFSDDIDWVRKNFGNRKDFSFIKLSTEHGDIDELMLMKNCHHIISANSTFSWWASWLNEKEDAIHICPAKRYANKQMIPPKWVKIDT